MEKSKRPINGLPYNLVQSYFSTLNYMVSGYMCDWIVNGALKLGITSVRLDILNETIAPPKMQFHAIIYPLRYVKPIIEKELAANELPLDYIKEAIFNIEISGNREMICNSQIIGRDDRVFKGKVYREKSYNEFDPQELEHELLKKTKRKNKID